MDKKTIGFLVTSSAIGNLNLIIEGARAYADTINVHLVRFTVTTRFPSEPHPHQLEVLLDIMKNANLSGLLYLGWIEEFQDPAEAFRCLRALGDIPIVNVGRSQDYHPAVRLNGAKQLESLLRHAIDVHQQKRILFICPITHDDRVDAYEKFMREEGFFAPDLMIRAGDLDMTIDEQWQFEKRAHSIMKRIRELRLLHRFDAIVSMYRREVVSLTVDLEEHGLSIPQDFGTYCWDEDERSAFHNPPLTTIHYPFWDLGFQGCRMLDELMRGNEVPMERFVPGHLIVRRSCGCGQDWSIRTSSREWLTFDPENFLKRLLVSWQQDQGLTFSTYLENWLEARVVQRGFRDDFILDLMDLQNLARKRLSELMSPDEIGKYWLHLLGSLSQRMDFLLGKATADRTEIERNFAELGQKLLSATDQENLLSHLPSDLGGIRMDAWVYLVPEGHRTGRLPGIGEYQLAKAIIDRTDYTPGKDQRSWAASNPFLRDDRPLGTMDYLHLLCVNANLMGFIIFRSSHHDERTFNNLAVELSSALQSVHNLQKIQRNNRNTEKLLKLSQKLSLIREEAELVQEMVPLVRKTFGMECVYCFVPLEDGVTCIASSDRLHHRDTAHLAELARELMRAPQGRTHSDAYRRGIHTVLLAPTGENSASLVMCERPDSRIPRDPSFFGLLSEQLSSNLQSCRFNQALVAARLTAEYANRAKSQFLASMSHELRTPLNSILGFAQILESNTQLGEEVLEDVSTIRESGEHLLNLINDVLDMAKIEAGHLELVPDILDVRGFLRELNRMLKMRAYEKRLKLQWEIQEDLPHRIYADQRRLRQILLNLLSNALKFTEKGEVHFRVRVSDENPEGTSLHFEVEDTGPGIAATDQAKLFRPFEQFGDHRSKAAGAGLGLAISRELVRAMGGDLHCISEAGKGSTFWFAIRVKSMESGASVARTTSAPTALPPGVHFRILVVDDKRNNRAFIARFLKPLGFSVTEAEDGNAALEECRKSPPDMVITDLVMPGMDGFELIKRMKSDRQLKSIPILVVSASVFEENSRLSLELGADAFLPKPLDISSLNQILRRFLHWDQVDQTDTPIQVIGPESFPPREEIENLARMVKEGSILEVDRVIKENLKNQPEWEGFWTQAARLSGTFQESALMEIFGEVLNAR